MKLRAVVVVLALIVVATVCLAKRLKAESCEQGSLKLSTARGLQCLHCTHPRAVASARGLLQAALNSCQKNIGFGFVLDGSFGNRFAVLNQIAEALLAANRQPYFHLYLLNGPAQRRYRDHVFPDSPFQINPYKFRQRIRDHQRFRRIYTKHVQRFAPQLRALSDQGVVLSVAPMLEDNLDDQSFNLILQLTLNALPKDIPIKFVRSPCRDCFAGNGGTIPLGVSREEHRGDLNFDFSHGVYSNDGWGYVRFPGDSLSQIEHPVSHTDRRVEEVISLDDLKPALQKADKQDDLFLLWLSKFQDTLPGNRSLKVSARKFRAPSSLEIRLIAEFLGATKNGDRQNSPHLPIIC